MEIPFQDLTRTIKPQVEEIKQAISKVVISGQYLRGLQVEQFEQEWASYCGQKYCVACANGTDAITIAAKSLNLREAKIPANTVWYTAEGLHRAGCIVHFVDIDKKGKIVDVDKITVPVPLYGSRPSITESECIFFDGAQAHGWKPPSQAVVAWSFYPTKTLGSLGDAGCITTNYANLVQTMRILSGRDDCYRTPDQIVSRMSEIQAAILRVRLLYLDQNIEKRKQIATWYQQYLPTNVSAMFLTEESSFYLFVVIADQRNKLSNYLTGRGVGNKIHYSIATHRYNAPWGKPDLSLPMAEFWCDNILSLPCYPGLTEGEVYYVSKCICDFYGR